MAEFCCSSACGVCMMLVPFRCLRGVQTFLAMRTWRRSSVCITTPRISKSHCQRTRKQYVGFVPLSQFVLMPCAHRGCDLVFLCAADQRRWW